MAFDPSSKFLAAGTSDSHIKIFDVSRNYQTHNFLGHRGIIQKLVFHPEANSLKLLSCAEDFVIRVWDLVLKKEVAVMKPKGKDDNMAHMTTSLVFTNDRKTLITGGRDSCLHFWNVQDNFKHISSVKIESLGALKFDEINCLVYVGSKEDPCIIIGGSSGQVLVYSVKR
jgi:U3 small nucleolar RNA-associated protein 13